MIQNLLESRGLRNPSVKIGLRTIVSGALLAFAVPALADGDPWTSAATNLQAAFTGPIAKGLALVAIVVGGLGFAFGEAGSKRALAGIIFGVGMAISAANFMAWLFG
jgi:type IV secretion system protein TrbC